MTRPCLAPLPDITPITLNIPAHACDSHAHSFGPYDAYPLSEERSYTPDPQTGKDFVAHLDQIGFERGVLVTGSACGQDNARHACAVWQFPTRM
jgi:predicted TIM-barrel fold metal-dependent hydrolase